MKAEQIVEILYAQAKAQREALHYFMEGYRLLSYGTPHAATEGHARMAKGCEVQMQAALRIETFLESQLDAKINGEAALKKVLKRGPAA